MIVASLMVTAAIVPPSTLSPLIWSLARLNVPPDTSRVLLEPTVISQPAISPPLISKADPSISLDPAVSFPAKVKAPKEVTVNTPVVAL